MKTAVQLDPEVVRRILTPSNLLGIEWGFQADELIEQGLPRDFVEPLIGVGNQIYTTRDIDGITLLRALRKHYRLSRFEPPQRGRWVLCQILRDRILEHLDKESGAGDGATQ